MSERQVNSDPQAGDSFRVSAPQLSLPKGGGAIRGMGEKFSANPVTGTGSLSVPIIASPGRAGFGPQLSLSYDSGAGNGPFGFGWSLATPSITRKTDKGLPQYRDTEGLDTFIHSGAEDLVPEYRQNIDGTWVRDAKGDLVVHEDELDGYRVRRFRPRIEGLFARTERWTRLGTPTDVHWRSITKDNVLTVYGMDANSRIADPLDASRIFTWLICETRDDKGNAMLYRYKAEDGAGVLLERVTERNRGPRNDSRRAANRYLKSIHYGNRTPLLDNTGRRPRFLDKNQIAAQIANADWMFELVFDYGEHNLQAPKPNDALEWPFRVDPFSSYRASFEIRTTRLCRRALMFHHFPTEADVGRDCLVRSTDFTYSDELNPAAVRNPVYTFLRKVTQCGYRRNVAGFDKRNLPPVEFTYTEPQVQDTVEDIDPISIKNLPIGLDGNAYQWTDLYGEGIPGLLTEQANAWYYKRNLSPLPVIQATGGVSTIAQFAPIETVKLKPNLSLANGAQFLDLAGDGQVDIVMLHGPAPGFYEQDDAESWQPFRSFKSLLNRDMRDPNMKFIDLDGDGHADVLITEDDAFIWHAALAEDGFGVAQKILKTFDEEKGPRIVFADGTQSIYLADLSGDGLTDIVRIRNGEVCYWPNLGYCRFGAKVTMEDSPWFDSPDQFDHQRIRLADIDGSGTTDILYLHRDGVRLYFNQSGNGWSQPQRLNAFPRIDNTANVVAIDLLGNGTACLVWSSSLPQDAQRRMQYVNLMGAVKPHLLFKTVNNLGAETRVYYAPSTKFYLQDKRDGKPWITRLPFPVHVVERVETYDYIGRNRFATRYAYHHGYFDGEEREFRGFGMVEQWDTDLLAALVNSDVFPNGNNVANESYVPPVYTKTWFHTGVYVDREHVSDYYAGLSNAVYKGEYFREPGLTDSEARDLLLPDTILPTGLSLAEEREACRSLKGSMLRQEMYALDGSAKESYPYTVTEQTFGIRLLQTKGDNCHAVFFAHPLEAINFHYERNPADPRIQHALTLEVDAFGNVLKQAAVGYGRRASILVAGATGQQLRILNPGLNGLTAADRQKQTTSLVTFTENSVTNAIDSSDSHRNPIPCEIRTFELTGYIPGGAAARFQATDLVEPDPQFPQRIRQLYVSELSYEDSPAGAQCRRLIEHLRTLYRNDDLSALCPLGTIESRAIVSESFQLVFTPGLLIQIFQRPHPNQSAEILLTNPANILAGQSGNCGGYLQSQQLKALGHFPNSDIDDHWWMPSGQSFFTTNAADTAATEISVAQNHFFIPRRFRDPFGNDTTITLDAGDLLMVDLRDALGNRTTVDNNDYRTLQPSVVSDANGNRTQVAFDMLGMVVGTAVMNKAASVLTEGDSLAGIVTDLGEAATDDLHDAVNPNPSAATLLKNATTRIVYDLGRFQRTQLANPHDVTKWLPPYAATLARETHVHDLVPNQVLKIQIAFSYSDGFGREIQKKAQIDPATDNGIQGPPRWVASGSIVFNNKGKPVRKYEPLFTATQAFELGASKGVSPVLFYDPVERVIATLYPNNTYEKVVFDPWQQTTYDVNDTVAPRNSQSGDPRSDADIGGYVSDFFASQPVNWKTWHSERVGGLLGTVEQTAANRASVHADTPTTMHFDALGRPFLTVARNRVVCAGHDLDGAEDSFLTRIDLDVEGNQRVVRDAITNTRARDAQGNFVDVEDSLGRVVMRYDYDMVGNRVCQASMEAGARWTIFDVSAKPIRQWDSRGHNFVTVYDALRRPIEQYVRGTTVESDPRTSNRDLLVDKIEYGESIANGETLNLRTRVYRHFDSAGIAINARLDANHKPIEAFDFKGNLLCSTRRLVSDYSAIPDWLVDQRLEDEQYVGRTRFDALNRPIQSIAPHSDSLRAKCNVIQPVFNEGNLLKRVDVWLNRDDEPTAMLDPNVDAPNSVGLTHIDYDAKGQRLSVAYTNGVVTNYDYDPLTFRLIRLRTRREAVTFPNDCPQPMISGWPGCQVQSLIYTYDPIGNITHVKDDSQQAIYFRNKRVDPCSDYIYDAAYRLVQASGREHLGQGGASVLHTNNDASRTRLLSTDGTGNFGPNDGNAVGTYIERYVYDAVGNFLKMQHRGSDPIHAGWTRGYAYLDASLLEDGTGTTSLKSNSRLTNTTVNSSNSADPVDNYEYDAHGNMTRMPHLGGALPGSNLFWDHKNQLRRVNLGGGGTAFYIYDASGQRVRKVWEKSAGLTEERIYLGGFEVFRKHDGVIGNNTATLERETLHIVDDKQRIALVETRSLDVAGDDSAPPQLIRYQLGNHLGSASLELDHAGKIISYEEYSPYGSSTYQAVRSATETPKRYRYTGKERDEESGLYYHGARFYAAWLGRWTSCDPSWKPTLYLYARANPIRFFDPNGKDDEPGLWESFRRSDTGQFLGGVAAGTTSSFIPGGFLLAPLGQETGVLNTPSRAFQAGLGAGEFATGIAQLFGGGGGEVGGVALDVTGVGALAGVPINIASAVLIVQGVTNVGAGIGNFSQALSRDPDPVNTPSKSTSNEPKKIDPKSEPNSESKPQQKSTESKPTEPEPLSSTKPTSVPETLRLPTTSVANNIAREGGLTQLANKVKGLGQGKGATVEIVLARTKDGKQILVAGINSGSKGLNASQLKQLKEWGVNIAPEIAKGMKGAPHAEENIAAYLSSIGARGERWSQSVVGALKPNGSSYVCNVCKAMIDRVGGRIEELQ